MRRILIAALILATIATPFVVAVGDPKAPPRCTIRGTPGDDARTGTKRGDVICTFSGDDFLHGANGDDVLRAGRNADTVVGGGGKDILRGGAGNDRLFAVDDRGGERLIGGRGRDQCFADRGDVVFGCDKTFRGLSVEVVRGLTRAAYRLAVLVEAVPTPTVPPPPVVTVVVTKTVVVPFPPCTPPPVNPPPPC